ncbi:hypothetical protein ACFXCZ_29450 [Streptomyces sp. NPDC059396]|uniref:hypothetical protein n=1 Tax=Streptomyces sp. NPDC059396 TaxID=3346819 RepID=UPI0036917628
MSDETEAAVPDEKRGQGRREAPEPNRARNSPRRKAAEPGEAVAVGLDRSSPRVRTPRSVRLRARFWLRVGLALSGWGALAVTVLPAGSPLRWVPVLLFVALGPGFALLLPRPAGARPRPGARLEVLALAAPLSLSLAALVATVLYVLAVFSVALFLGALAAFCTVAAALPAVPLPASAVPGPRKDP